MKQLLNTDTLALSADVAAANDECFVGAALAEQIITTQEPTSGWNAFEVWRTRVWETHGPGPRAT